jgi:hypothetical protein
LGVKRVIAAVDCFNSYPLQQNCATSCAPTLSLLARHDDRRGAYHYYYGLHTDPTKIYPPSSWGMSQNIQKQTEAKIEGIEFYELYNEPFKPYPESNFGFMADPVTIKPQILVAAAYSCGQLSDGEKNTLISSGLFTATELSNLQASCQ